MAATGAITEALFLKNIMESHPNSGIFARLDSSSVDEGRSVKCPALGHSSSVDSSLD